MRSRGDREEEQTATFTCSEFAMHDRLMVGTDSGDVRVYEWNEKIHNEKKVPPETLPFHTSNHCRPPA